MANKKSIFKRRSVFNVFFNFQINSKSFKNDSEKRTVSGANEKELDFVSGSSFITKMSRVKIPKHRFSNKENP
jgi:hypothetical protein